MLLFVYGTLMTGYGNNRLLAGQRLVGRALTVHKYAMFAAGIPFVHPTMPRCRIHGEVWELADSDTDALARLDKLEGHPDFYVRTTIEVELLQDGAAGGPPAAVVVQAEIYFNSFVEDVQEIESGDFRQAHRPM